MNRFFGHLKTVLHHKRLVFHYACKAGIPWQGFFHDTSKFSPVEFFPGVKYFTDGTRSPNVAERIDKGYSSAWLHHKGRNKHHFEYWTELNYAGKDVFVCPMPLRYVKEMFCDRVAATKTYLKDNYTDRSPLEYYLRKNERAFMHEQTYTLLEKLLVMLAEKGEKETFSYLKKLR